MGHLVKRFYIAEYVGCADSAGPWLPFFCILTPSTTYCLGPSPLRSWIIKLPPICPCSGPPHPSVQFCRIRSHPSPSHTTDQVSRRFMDDGVWNDGSSWFRPDSLMILRILTSLLLPLSTISLCAWLNPDAIFDFQHLDEGLFSQNKFCSTYFHSKRPADSGWGGEKLLGRANPPSGYATGIINNFTALPHLNQKNYGTSLYYLFTTIFALAWLFVSVWPTPDLIAWLFLHGSQDLLFHGPPLAWEPRYWYHL